MLVSWWIVAFCVVISQTSRCHIITTAMVYDLGYGSTYENVFHALYYHLMSATCTIPYSKLHSVHICVLQSIFSKPLGPNSPST